jgi:signal transduction histidine kinase
MPKLNAAAKSENIDFSHVSSVRGQLFRYIVSSIIGILFLFSLTIIGLTQSGAGKLIVENAQEITKALAQQSTLALLTESTENSEAALQQVISFPDVVGAGLVNLEGSILDWQGEPQGRLFFSNLDWASLSEEEKVVYESNDGFWHIAHHVVLDGNNDDDSQQTELLELTDQKLGFAIVTFSKDNLFRIQNDLVITISITALIAIIGLPLIISWVVARLLAPLGELSHVMAYNKDKGEHQSAEVKGAREFQQIAASFNDMIETLDEQDDKLRNHRDQLEAEVNIRTRELVVARDAAMTSNRYKSEFLTNVTHELRTPIQSIIGYVELVKEELENEESLNIHNDLDKVTRNAERLYSLINNVLDLSKIEAGKMDIHYTDILISTLLKDLQDAISPLIPQNNNTLSIQLECEGITVNMDREKVLQILINLVSNACKFTKDGQITLIIEKQPRHLNFKVMDTGIGIPADRLETVFNKFQQIDGSETRTVGGTGLGLAISRHFCDLMQAQLTAESQIGKGSCFALSIPV